MKMLVNVLEDGIFVAPGERHGTPAPEGSQVTPLFHKRAETSHVEGRRRGPSYREKQLASPVFVSAGYREWAFLRFMGWLLMVYADDGILWSWYFRIAVACESSSFDVRMKVKHKAFELYQTRQNSLMLIYFVPSLFFWFSCWTYILSNYSNVYRWSLIGRIRHGTKDNIHHKTGTARRIQKTFHLLSWACFYLILLVSQTVQSI